MLEKGSERPQSSDRRIDQACERAGEQALKQSSLIKKDVENLSLQ